MVSRVRMHHGFKLTLAGDGQEDQAVGFLDVALDKAFDKLDIGLASSSTGNLNQTSGKKSDHGVMKTLSHPYLASR